MTMTSSVVGWMMGLERGVRREFMESTSNAIVPAPVDYYHNRQYNDGEGYRLDIQGYSPPH